MWVDTAEISASLGLRSKCVMRYISQRKYDEYVKIQKQTQNCINTDASEDKLI